MTTVISEWSDPVAFSIKGAGEAFVEQGKLAVSGVAAGNQFGHRVAISGDGQVALVSARYDKTYNASGNGAVYYYTKSNGVWVQQSKIYFSEAASTTLFGDGLALNQDGTVALISIMGKTINASSEGLVYQFTRSGNTWTQGSVIVPPDWKISKNFGSAISLSSDGTVAAIGANGDRHYGTGAGACYIFKLLNGVWTYHQKLYTQLTAPGNNYGYGVALSGDKTILAVGGVGAADYAVAIYTLVNDLYVEQTQIVVPYDYANGSGTFGAGLALNSDGTLLAVGSSTDNSALGGANATGTLYVFRRSGTVWSLSQKQYASDGVNGDSYGLSVAMTGDATTIMVGSPLQDTLGTDAGSVYVLTASGPALTERNYIAAPDGLTIGTDAYFGCSVSLSADGKIAVVGAYNASSGKGMVFLYYRNGDQWVCRKNILVGATGDQAGLAVAISGDGKIVVVGSPGFNSSKGVVTTWTLTNATLTQTNTQIAGTVAEGFGRGLWVNNTGTLMVVGASSAGLSGAGRIAIYTRTTGDWTLQQSITCPDADSAMQFGNSISMNAAGTKALIGAPGTTSPLVYYYTISGTTWTLQQRIAAPNGSQFGKAVALSYDGLTAYIGAPADTGRVADTGAVHVYSLLGSTWSYSRKIASGQGLYATSTSRRFGSSLSIVSDGTILMVGQPYDQGPGTGRLGSVAVFAIPSALLASTVSDQWTARNRITDPTVYTYSDFGFTVVISPDGNTAVIGNPQASFGTSSVYGAAYVYVREGTSWNLVANLVPEVTMTNGMQFGGALAFSGDGNTIAVGCGSSTAVYVFVKSGSAWIYQAAVSGTDTITSDYFGYSVALSSNGSTLVVGAMNRTEASISGAGAVYVFTRNGTTWSQAYKLTSNNKYSNGNFGCSVAVTDNGSIVVVGAKGELSGFLAGRAYVYTNGTLTANLTGTSMPNYIYFGTAVAVNGDGKRIAVMEPGSASASGFLPRVYLFHSTNLSTWTQQPAILTGSFVETSNINYRSLAFYNNGDSFIVVGNSRTALLFDYVSSVWTLRGPIDVNGNLSTTTQSASAAVSSDGSVVLLGDINAAEYGLNNGPGVVTAFYKGAVAYPVTEKRAIVPRQKLFSSVTNAYRFGGNVAVDATETYALVTRLQNQTGNQIVYYKKVNGYWVYQNEFTSIYSINSIGGLAMTSDGLMAAVADISYSNNSGCFYVFTRSGDTWSHLSRVTPSAPVANANFGFSLSFSGDSTRFSAKIAVGSYRNSTKATEAGAVYTFSYNGTTWTQDAAILYSPSPASSGYFGSGVALSNNGTWLVVGETGGAGGGFAYLYQLLGGTYSLVKKLIPYDARNISYGTINFGYGVSITPDGKLIAVAALTATSKNNQKSGVLYLYSRVGTKVYLRTIQGADDGWSNSLSGGLANGVLSPNGSRLFMALSQDTERDTDSGAVYINDITLSGTDIPVPTGYNLAAAMGVMPYSKVAINRGGQVCVTGYGSTNQVRVTSPMGASAATLIGSDTIPNDFFGYAVSAAFSSPNAYVAVGAYNKTGTYTNQGAVYVFSGATVITMTQQAKLLASDPANNDSFGYSVALSSDGGTALVGAVSKSGTRDSQGAAYVFTRSGSTWTQQAKLLASDPAASDSFGCSVALSSDGSTAAVGAYKKTGTYSNQGAVYIFTRSGTTWTQQAKVVHTDPAANDYFGRYQVSLSGDGNTLAVSAADKATSLGAVYIFTRSGSTWTQQAKLVPSVTTGVSFFGYGQALSTDGNTLAVAMQCYGDIFQIYTRSGSTWTQGARVSLTDATQVGSNVANLAMVGDASIIAAGYTNGVGFFTDLSVSPGNAYA